MEEIRQYIFSITAASIICAMLTHLSSGKGKTSELIKMLCGIFVILTVIRPVAQVRIDEFSEYGLSISADAREAVSEGEIYASNSISAIIKQETQAYILDKAAELNADITVDIVLSKDPQPVPKEVYIQGSVSPTAKNTLQEYISEDIGIPKECQIWIQ